MYVVLSNNLRKFAILHNVYVCTYTFMKQLSLLATPQIHDHEQRSSTNCQNYLLSGIPPVLVGGSGAMWRVRSEHLMMSSPGGALTRWAPPPVVMGVWTRRRRSIWARRPHRLPRRRSSILLPPMSPLWTLVR